MNSIASTVDQELPFSAENKNRESEEKTVLTPVMEHTAELNSVSSDLELVRLAADGNLAAFELIYRRYYRRTFSLALRMTGSQTEAEDLTQEVFIQLFRKIGSFRGDSAFSTWLHRLTVNQVLMHFRKRSFKTKRPAKMAKCPNKPFPALQILPKWP